MARCIVGFHRLRRLTVVRNLAADVILKDKEVVPVPQGREPAPPVVRHYGPGWVVRGWNGIDETGPVTLDQRRGDVHAHALPVQRDSRELRAPPFKEVERGDERRAFDENEVPRADECTGDEIDRLLGA